MPTGMSAVQDWADDVEDQAQLAAGAMENKFSIVNEARLLGGAMIVILLVAVVLNEVFAAVDVGSGPFSSIGEDLQTTGVAAIGLLIVGLIVVAANAIMQRFGGSM
jgi:hypothetical protein